MMKNNLDLYANRLEKYEPTMHYKTSKYINLVPKVSGAIADLIF